MFEDAWLSQKSLVKVINSVPFEALGNVIGHELVFDELFNEGGLNEYLGPVLAFEFRGSGLI